MTETRDTETADQPGDLEKLAEKDWRYYTEVPPHFRTRNRTQVA